MDAMAEQTQPEKTDLPKGIVLTLETLVDLSKRHRDSRFFTVDLIYQCTRRYKVEESFNVSTLKGNLDFAVERGYAEKAFVEGTQAESKGIWPLNVTCYRPNVGRASEFLRLHESSQPLKPWYAS